MPVKLDLLTFPPLLRQLRIPSQWQSEKVTVHRRCLTGDINLSLKLLQKPRLSHSRVVYVARQHQVLRRAEWNTPALDLSKVKNGRAVYRALWVMEPGSLISSDCSVCWARVSVWSYPSTHAAGLSFNVATSSLNPRLHSHTSRPQNIPLLQPPKNVLATVFFLRSKSKSPYGANFTVKVPAISFWANYWHL